MTWFPWFRPQEPAGEPVVVTVREHMELARESFALGREEVADYHIAAALDALDAADLSGAYRLVPDEAAL